MSYRWRVTGVALTIDDGSMTVHSGKRWWIVGVGLGLMVFALGGFLVKTGLENADRWASVIGLFLNIAGLAVTVISAVQARRRGTGTAKAWRGATSAAPWPRCADSRKHAPVGNMR